MNDYTLTTSRKAAISALTDAHLLAIVREDNRKLRGGVPTSAAAKAEAMEAREVLARRVQASQEFDKPEKE